MSRKTRSVFDSVGLLQYIDGRRLWASIAVLCVLAAELIVSAMDLILNGEITADYLLTGLVAAGIVVPPSLALLHSVLVKLAHSRHELLEKSARYVENRLKVALEAAHLICWEVDFVRDDLRYDESMLPLLGMEPADAPRSLAGWLERVHPDDRAEFRQLLQASLQAGDPTFDFEYRIEQQSGQWGWLHTHGRVFRRDQQGQAESAVGTTRNITERMQAEAALRHNRTLMRSILQASDEGILVIARDGSVLSTNQRFLELWRVPQALADAGRDEVLLAHARSQLTDPEQFLSRVRRLYDSDEEARDTLYFKDGRVFARFTRALSVEGEPARIWCFKDITERTRALANLAESRKLLQTVIDTAPVRVFWKDRNLRYMGCNPPFARDAGMPDPQAVVGKDDHQMAWSNQASQYRADDIRVMESGVPKLGYVEPQTTPEGRTMWLRTSKVPLRGADNQIFGLLGIYDDITEQKRNEDALRETAFLLKESQQIGQLGGWRADPTRNTVMWTEGVYAIVEMPLDYQPDLETGLDCYLPDSRERVKANLQRAAQTGEPFTVQVEIRGARSGKTKWTELRGFPHHGPDGQIDYLMGTLQDITDRRDLEAAMRAEIELRRRMMESLPGVLYLFDKSGRFLSWNRNFETITQRSAEELALTHPLDLFEGDEKALVAQRIQQVFEMGHGDVEACIVAKDGSRTSLYLTGLSIEVAGEQAVIGTGVDISARQQAEAELERHRHHLVELVQRRTSELMATEARASHILQSSADGLYGVDAGGIVTFINPAALAMLGYTAEQVIGHSGHALFHHSKPDGSPYPWEECPGHNALRLGRDVRIDDEVYWHADGHAVPVMYSVHPMLHDGEFTAAVISVVDMSEQRAAAEARERALIAAENLARVRSEFLANMSHEIRTPLNGVLGFAQIGCRNYQNSEKARNAFEKIIASGNLLLGVINEILDFSKIEAGKLRIDPIAMSPAEVIEHVTEVVADRARAKQLELRVELGPDLPGTCIADPLRLGQILLNLLSNAVKFTETGGVTLSASRRGDGLVFRVTDTGIGMSDEQLGLLFQPFQQADGSTTRKFGGTGLGLAITKRMLELMDGDIRVQSRPGTGSTFEFRIPCVRPSAPAEPPAHGLIAESSVLEKPLAGISILVAEDDAINQLVLEENLREDGARVVLADNGREAVERVTQDGASAYDIVLMDIQMPEMDGYEATRRIVALAPGLPVIGQTAHALAEERDKCLAAGMVAHIAKPIDPRKLTGLVQQHVAEKWKSGQTNRGSVCGPRGRAGLPPGPMTALR